MRRDHLLLAENSSFTTMLASAHWQPKEDGTYFIDVSIVAFEHVLKLLREPENVTAVAYLSAFEKVRLNETLEFLHLPPLRLGWRDIAGCDIVDPTYRQLLVDVDPEEGYGGDSI